MSFLSWNCRGLANPCAVHMLADLVRERWPDFVFFIKTICDLDRFNELNKLLGYASSFVVPRNGHSGGLAFLYKNDGSTYLLGKAYHFIDVEIRLEGESPYRLTGYYGHTNRNHRYFSWTLSHTLASRYTMPQCIIGDFNDLTSISDKRGRVAHPPHLFHGFHKAIEDCGLQDLGFVRSPFTWERHRDTVDWVKQQLDRALATASWV